MNTSYPLNDANNTTPRHDDRVRVVFASESKENLFQHDRNLAAATTGDNVIVKEGTKLRFGAAKNETFSHYASSIEDRLDRLEASLMNQHQTIQNQTQTIRNQTQTISGLRDEISQQNRTISGLRDENTQQNRTISGLRDEIDVLNARTGHMQSRLDEAARWQNQVARENNGELQADLEARDDRIEFLEVDQHARLVELQRFSHAGACPLCFEHPTAVMLTPCRHVMCNTCHAAAGNACPIRGCGVQTRAHAFRLLD